MQLKFSTSRPRIPAFPPKRRKKSFSLCLSFKNPPWKGFCGPALFYHKHSVAEHMNDASRMLSGALKSGPVLNRLGVENNDIGCISGLQQAAPRQAQPCRRRTAHFTNGLL